MGSDDETASLPSELSIAVPSTPRSYVDEAQMGQERWEDFAAMAESARGFSRLEALDTVLPHVPNGPHGRLLERALLRSEDLPATLSCVERAASAMARAMEAISSSPAFACGT